MLTRKNQKNGEELSILGFGCMRFPTKTGSIDEPRAIAMIRDSIEKGVNYFDTAYIYHAGRSESLLGQALSGGYRERVRIATKLPPFMVRKIEDARKIFEKQLSRLKTDYIDYYLLHMLTDKPSFDRLAGLGVLKWLEELKEKGTVKNIGFSFHGGKADFESILKAYPWDFCQIQYNYMDENNQATRDGLRLAASMGIPVIVMEPLRGGKLVTHLPQEVKKAFNDYDKDRSPAEWAFRWIWNHPEVNVVLSGMSDEAQVADNIRMASDAVPNSLSKEELAVFENVKKVMHEKTKIPCTACGYCLPCPAGVDIPACFSHYNDKYLTKDRSVRIRYFQSLGALAAKPAYASRCMNCGKCESHCPQSIAIRSQLKVVSREMEGILYRPIVGIARKFMRIK
ncbi:aldo/keto reductase [Ruminiclostridium cellobioparum]|uniref:Putative oxidoreductases of the aldo/keto reductase family n=1 Tax=Ruminiclostridium cellobioparum subsp. termitidis CT1112 TaxID=1195236 RepID=S0FRJ8_RUMCE|nr:aldo/keto reductase [Ruminiclostridium cellobioparum]EMS71804.1 putative oxidoreductases of the aldo/keto reductase family [Ruminiclostridium cellobioparum subsp. termitidis CT1112]